MGKRGLLGRTGAAFDKTGVKKQNLTNGKHVNIMVLTGAAIAPDRVTQRGPKGEVPC